jgi:hypothetical protein
MSNKKAAVEAYFDGFAGDLICRVVSHLVPLS